MNLIFNIIKINYIKTFDFKSRQGRMNYWVFFLLSICLLILTTFLVMQKNYLYFSILYPLILIPLFSASARRLHDAESGNEKKYIGIWFGLSFLFVNLFNVKLGSPYISLQALWLIVFIIFQCRKSNPKTNAYGKLE